MVEPGGEQWNGGPLFEETIEFAKQNCYGIKNTRNPNRVGAIRTICIFQVSVRLH